MRRRGNFFREAVEQTAGVEQAYREGLQALNNDDRRRINCKSPRSLAGSVNLDGALQRAYPNAPRWDYGIGIRGSGRNERVVWVEIHPADGHHVTAILNKLEWLRNWLGQAGALGYLKARFVWVSTGRIAITRQSRQHRKLIMSGLELKGRVLELP